MYCVASKQTGGQLWELTVRNGEHNHPPYEQTPKKKKSKRIVTTRVAIEVNDIQVTSLPATQASSSICLYFRHRHTA